LAREEEEADFSRDDWDCCESPISDPSLPISDPNPPAVSVFVLLKT